MTQTAPGAQRPARPSLGALTRAGQERSTAALLKRVLPAEGDRGVIVAAFGSSV